VGDQTPDFWKKLEILLTPVGGLLTAISVAFIGIYGASVLNRKQEMDARAKVYAELTSQREQAETALRKDMFVHIIDSVLKPEKSSPDLTVLNMELLAYNFHESLDLKPLFSYVQRHLASVEQASAKQYLNRLEKVASDVTQKQLLVLEEGGQKFDRTIDLNALRNNPNGIVLDSESLKLAGIERVFQLVALDADTANHEIRFRLEIITLKPFPETKSITFSVGFYDFPMIDNTRLSEDQRCAVVLNHFCETTECNAEVTLVYFHGSRASLKEKTFSEDVIRNLQEPPASDATK
jgi:hypothetical protein